MTHVRFSKNCSDCWPHSNNGLRDFSDIVRFDVAAPGMKFGHYMAIALASRSTFSVFKYILGSRLDRALTVIRDGGARVGCRAQKARSQKARS